MCAKSTGDASMRHSCLAIEHSSKHNHVHPHTGALHAHCGCCMQLFCTTPLDHYLSHYLLYVPKAINQLTVRLAHVIQYAIQSLVKNPKQSKIPHPSIQNGTYWRRIRNKTRRLHKQPVYRYIKVLCWLHHCIQVQQSTPQQPKCSKQHASQPDIPVERPDHMQGEAKCDKTGDKNVATQQKPDHRRDTHNQERRAARAHHRRSACAVIHTRNITKHASTTQPYPYEMHDAQMICVVPAEVLCINALSCCRHALNYRQMTYSGTIDLNMTREQTILLMCTYRGGSQQPHIPDGEPDLGPNNDLYTPFSGSSREWLSNNHISNCVLYLLHMRYPDAKHHNMAGVTHPVPSVQELLHKVKQAEANSPLEYSTDISQAMRDALSPDGPSPAITFGDNIHWRVMLINARRKHVDFADCFGAGFLHSVRTSVQVFYKKDNTGTWTFTEWTKRLQPRGDTWNCGLWAIWIQEKWMQYWSQTEATEAFADWLRQDIDRIPQGQNLRKHYHVVMQLAGTAAEGGTTDLYQSREISASRMANQRDKQALYDTYKQRMHQHANSESANRWHTSAQRPMAIPDSPDIQERGNGQTQSKKVSTIRPHRNLGNSLSSLHTSTRMHGKIHKKPKLIHTASTGRLLSWLQGGSNTNTKDKVHHDRNEAGMQHNTSSIASCQLAHSDHSRHTHEPGSIQACFAKAPLKGNTIRQQLAPGVTVNTSSPTALQNPPAKDNITVDKEMCLQPKKIDSDCSIICNTSRKAHKARQASTLSETCRAGMTSHTNKQPATTQEKKRKVAGAYTPCCDTLTVLTWNVMGSTTVPDELMQIIQQREPWVIVLTETKLTDARQDRVFFQEYLPEYTMYHSCVKGNDSGHCRTGSGGVAIAVHKSLTSQNSVELITTALQPSHT